MGIRTALDAVEQAPRIVDAMRLADDLAFEAGRDPGVRTLRVLASAIAGAEDVTVIAAVHALAEVYDEAAAQVLVSLLSDPRPFVREHATEALAQAPARPEAISRLVGAVVDGGFTGMLAQRTIENWSTTSGPSSPSRSRAPCSGSPTPRLGRRSSRRLASCAPRSRTAR